MEGIKIEPSELGNSDQPFTRLQRQAELESEMRGEGIKRFRIKVEEACRKDREMNLPSGQVLLQKAFEPVQKAVAIKMEEMAQGKADRNAAYSFYISSLPSDVLAFLALKGVLDTISKTTPVTHLAHTLGALCEDEVNFRAIRGEQPYLFDKVISDLNTRSGSRIDRQRTMRHIARQKEITLTRWPNPVKLSLGAFLLDIVMQETGLVEMTSEIYQGKKQRMVVKPTEKTMEWIRRKHELCELLSPIFLPMVIEPRPWKTPWDGGYLNNQAFRLTLVKTGNREYLQKIALRDMPDVYDAVNVVQSTPWRVNLPVLQTLSCFWDNDVEIANVPRATRASPPAKPADYDTNPEARREWKHQRSVLERDYDRQKSKRLAIAKAMWVAEKFKDEPEIFFPHTLDFRGRMYPVPLYLNPQGSDLCRGLLTFAYGKPLGDVGVRWLKIHGANNFGFDKASLDERVEWVNQHESRILACAENPFDNRWWAEAENPWQFLAFCFEYYGYFHTGPEFVSALPVGMDGSCNGLQNFSAMLRDEIGGAAVNLVPSDKVQDIYLRVADVVNRKLEERKAGDATAAKWVGHVTRKIVKRPVMTLPYSATVYGMGEQIEQELIKMYVEAGHGTVPFTSKEIHWMAKLIYESIGEVVVAARTAMDWLKKVAEVAASDDLPVWWEAPNGLLVYQAYRKQRKSRVMVAIAGAKVHLVIQNETDKLNKHRQSSGISPNFVHSCDASHMMLTVINALGRGVDYFAMIHDSYATLAADCPLLSDALREAFVEMYTRYDILARFRENLIQQLPPETALKLPELPPKGSLDIELVRQSIFFFH